MILYRCSGKKRIKSITIDGIYEVGNIISSLLIPSDATVTYQWYRGNTPISGATSSSYTLVDDDRGYTIKLVAKGTGPYRGTVTSNVSAVVKGWVLHTGYLYNMTSNTTPSPYSCSLTSNIDRGSVYTIFNTSGGNIGSCGTSSSNYSIMQIEFNKKVRVSKVYYHYSLTGIQTCNIQYYDGSSWVNFAGGTDINKDISGTYTFSSPTDIQGLRYYFTVYHNEGVCHNAYQLLVTEWYEFE